MEEPNNDIDTETLQAQIDLSMAYAQNLISSWLPTSGPMTQPSARAAEAEVELQALLRRPPRLGVGAPLPETSAPAQTRLVQKLEGGKRRVRELENGAQHAVMANKDEQEEEKDNAEESRAAEIAIRKRQRVDPFESGGKKKKRKVVVVGSVGTVETARAKDDDVEMEEASQSGSIATNDAMTRPGPRKKKKKKRMSENLGAKGLVVRREPSGDTQSARLDADITLHAESSDHSFLLEEWAGIAQDQQGSRCGTPSSYSVASSGVGASPPKDSPRLPSRSSLQPPTTPIPSARVASTLPILNLTGAPPIPYEEPSPLKKRRRKRKKKRPSSGQEHVDNPR